MKDMELNPEDLQQIREEYLSLDQVQDQLERFRRGTTPVTLLKPCVPGDGIESLSEDRRQNLIDYYEATSEKLEILKFVPASGAATRMFKDWFRLLKEDDSLDERASRHFGETVYSYAFSMDLQESLRLKNVNMDEYLHQGKVRDILAEILFDQGLNYGCLPKAMLIFHRYPQGCRTALAEHFVEAAGYARSRGNTCHIHFTVSEEFLDPVKKHIRNVISQYEKNYGVRYRVDLSVQKPSTNTIAVDLNNRPFRDDQGRLVFRPAGHGALLHNLNELDADVIFIKNIDNVSHDRLLEQTNSYKKILAGFLLKCQERVFLYLEMLSGKDISPQMIEEIGQYCRNTLRTHFPESYLDLPINKKSAILFDQLNRPIRVCGMVKNTGEPGGGPFWVVDEKGNISKQIIEQFQIDGTDAEQLRLWSSSTHFNPVDLVCGIKDYRGRRFDLFLYADQNAICISVKSEKGRSLKALELPGLWNGSMANWITIFLEVPIITFNPVKTVEDLLRKEHLPA
jgi:hypothetical protein